MYLLNKCNKRLSVVFFKSQLVEEYRYKLHEKLRVMFVRLTPDLYP